MEAYVFVHVEGQIESLNRDLGVKFHITMSFYL